MGWLVENAFERCLFDAVSVHFSLVKIWHVDAIVDGLIFSGSLSSPGINVLAASIRLNSSQIAG